MQQARRVSDLTACLMLDENAATTATAPASSPSSAPPISCSPTRRTTGPRPTSPAGLDNRRRGRGAIAAGLSAGPGTRSPWRNPKILVIEDEQALVEPLLQPGAARVSRCWSPYDGQDGPAAGPVEAAGPDPARPDAARHARPGGLQATFGRAPRTRPIPIIMVTAKAEESRPARRLRRRGR